MVFIVLSGHILYISIQHILQHATFTYIDDVVGAIAHQLAAIGYPIPSPGFSHDVPNIEITI